MRPPCIGALLGPALAAITAACGDFQIPNDNNPSVDILETNPTPAAIITATQGLPAGVRLATSINIASTGISNLSAYGREGYSIDQSFPPFSGFDFVSPGDGNGWPNTYRVVRQANAILDALDRVPTGSTAAELTAAQKEGIRGFAQTVEAYVLHGQLRVQDSFGIVVATHRKPSDPLGPIATKAEAFQYIARSLDEADGHLANADPAFAFKLGTGFTGFTTASTFRQVNRALRARVAIEMGDYGAALAALPLSFLTGTGAMDLGPKNAYGAAPDVFNPLFDAAGTRYVADTLLPRQAQLRTSGQVDLRVSSKMVQIAGGVYRNRGNITSNYRWTIYPTNVSPIPIIKNEELLLIRAEARYRTGDVPGALADINTVRTVSGGLPALTGFASTQAFEDELLYNRRYSLLFEYGHRWVDLRRFGRLGDFKGPRGPGDLIIDKVPFNDAECGDRGERGNTPRCSAVNGTRTTS